MSEFTAEEIKILKKIAKERQKKGAIPTKILFDRTKTVLKTIRLPTAMVVDSAKKEPNFNRLIEFLLWDFLGRDRKYLSQTTELESEEQ
ncbi:MAG: hypothetical protein ACP5U1_17110 [Desulfomonilaceae bacterium]